MKKTENNSHIDREIIKLEVKKIFANILNLDTKKADMISGLEELEIESFEGKLILAAIEEKFKITIDPENASRLRTFREILQLIEKFVENKKNK